MLTIKVLGPGCANCKKLEEVARRSFLQCPREGDERTGS